MGGGEKGEISVRYKGKGMLGGDLKKRMRMGCKGNVEM